jgi:integrase
MEGSIMGVIVRQKENGKGKPWYVFINYQGKRTARKFSTKAVAVAAGREIERLLVSGEFGKEQKIIPNFETYSQKWFDNYVCGQLRESTADEYESVLRIHVLPVFGRKPIDAISRATIRDFLVSKHRGGLSISRVLMIKDVLSSVFNYALDDEIIQANPTVKISKRLFSKNNGGSKPTEQDVFNEAQIEKLLAACSTVHPEYYNLFLISAKCGTRLGETIALKWGNIDFKNGFIWVKRSYRRGRITPPKNNKIRKVKMSAQLAKTLKAQLPKDADALITDYCGSYVPQNKVRIAHAKIIKAAGLKYHKFHSLRHSYASIMLSKGASPVFVKNQLGHSSIDITVDIYTH